MTPLIGENLKESLVRQISEEKYNAHLYLYIASFLNSKGLSKMAKHFEQQHDEEQKHAMEIYNLLMDLSVHFEFPEVDGCSFEFNGILSIADKYLSREVITTESLNEIKIQAVQESNAIVEERIREMILLQQHEYQEATDFMDKAELCGDNWMNVLIWNNTWG